MKHVSLDRLNVSGSALAVQVLHLQLGAALKHAVEPTKRRMDEFLLIVLATSQHMGALRRPGDVTGSPAQNDGLSTLLGEFRAVG